MKRKMFLGSLLMCCASWMMAQQTAQVDSLMQAETNTDSVVVTNDSTWIVLNDSTSELEVVDSTAIALRPLAQMDLDSTKLLMEQVKELTDQIAEQSLLNAILVKEVFSDSAIVNKYNRILDQMVEEYAAEMENISVHDTMHVNPLYFRLFAPLTLYKSPVTQAMSIEKYPTMTLEDSLRLVAMTSGTDMRLLNELDRVLLST